MLKRHPQFPLEENILYFNHAAVSPWPLCSAHAIMEFTRQNLHTGSKYYLKWMETEQELREMLCTLIHAGSSDDIALLKNTSEGLSVIAYGLDWQPGDNVVIPKNEFPSNRFVWQSLEKAGVETREIDIQSAEDAEQALINALDSRTRVLSVSAVQYTNGFRLDLEKLGNCCEKLDTLFVVDAIQQIGALEFDVSGIKADFAVADGHKWMMGPEGLALFYSRPASRNLLSLNQYGWRMVENPTDFQQTGWTVSHTAKRFECGSPNMLAIAALNASIKLITETGMRTIHETILDNTRNIIDFINNNNNYRLLSSSEANRLSGIVTFTHKSIDNADLFRSLTDDGLQCAERGNGIRLSPHFYNQKWEFGCLFDLLVSL